MSGLLFLAVLFIWLVVAVLLTRWLMRRVRIKSALARMVLALLAFTSLLALPVADEIVGSYQFRALCRENAVLRIDAIKARGRTVKVVTEPLNEILTGTAIPIYHSHESFRDIATREEIASNDWYVAKGGGLIRMLGLFEGNEPLLVSRSTCYPSLGRPEIGKAYSFTLIK